MKIRRTIPQENTQLQMSAMIDIVFLLLVFFVMTFKITAVEGDFFIHSQQSPDGQAKIGMDLPLRLQVAADADGEIKRIQLNNLIVADLDALQNELQHIGHQVARIANNSESQLVILKCDSHLRYECTIEVLTAVKRCEVDGVSFDIRFQSS